MVRLTAEQKDFYKKNGFIKLSGCFTEEQLDRMSLMYNRLFDRQNQDNLEASWQGSAMSKAASDINYSVKSIHNLQYHSAVFTEFMMNEHILDALEDVIESPNILLHHTKAHFKPPENGAPYLMHQDYHYFPFKKHSMTAVFIHVDEATVENGCLAIYPGSHLLGPQKDMGVIEKGQQYHYLDQTVFPLEKATPVPAKRGEVVIFNYLTIHGSYLNLSQHPRRMYLIQVMSAEDDPVMQVHKSHGQGLVLRGENVRADANFNNRFEEKVLHNGVYK